MSEADAIAETRHIVSHLLTSSPSHPLTSSPSHPLTLYNLASMRLTTQPRHGIFIKNNKKYVLSW